MQLKLNLKTRKKTTNCTKNQISQVLKYYGKNSKTPSKCHLSINFLAQKDRISVSFQWTVITINFLAQRKTVFLYLWKVENTKHGISCWRKYHLIVFLRTVTSSFVVLGSWFYIMGFVNKKERPSFYQFPALKKIYFCSQKSVISTFPLSEKFITWTFPFFLIWTFPSLQSSFLCNNFFSSFLNRNVCFFLNILKDLLKTPLWKWIKELLFFLIFQWLKHYIWECWWHQR